MTYFSKLSVIQLVPEPESNNVLTINVVFIGVCRGIRTVGEIDLTSLPELM